MVKLKVTLWIFLLILHQGLSKTYRNYTLYRGVPANDIHLNFFRNLTRKYDVNFWREPGILSKPVDFMISPLDQPAVLRDSKKIDLELTTILQDVQLVFDLQTVKSYIRRRTDTFDWRSYFRIDDIYNWLRDLATVYPRVMQIESIGKTVKGRDILAVVINLEDFRRQTRRTSTVKPKVIIEGGIHAREWVAPAFVTYMINSVVHAPYSNNTKLKNVAYTYEWFFVPVLNPDGYEYTHAKDRLWRKNRSNGNFGVDLNRNFAYEFGTKGVSFDKREEIYCGPHAFSENESRSLAKFVKANSNNLKFFIAFHSYGQYFIIPYADATKHVENYNEVYSMGKIAAKRIQSRHGARYTVGTAFDTVGYTTSGISGDWVKTTFKTPVVATFELRDQGQFGFGLPIDQILPCCEETMDGIISLLSAQTQQRLQDDVNNENLHEHDDNRDGQGRTTLDEIVVLCNVVWFIIVRFD